MLDAGFEVHENPEKKKYTEKELIAQLPGYDAAVVGSDPFTQKVIEAAAPRLRILAKSGVGVDNIDIPAATKNGVYVTSTTGSVDDGVADQTFALMLSIARGIIYLDRVSKEGQWPRYLGMDVSGKTLGIVGLGHIGREVALRAKGFRMKLLAYEPYPNDAFCCDHNITLCGLEQLCEESDFVTLHVPHTPQTHHILTEDLLHRMKKSAVLINTARGGLVDEELLYRALKEKWIYAAGVDCWEQEPTKANNPLFSLENCVCTPHVAGYTARTMYNTGMMVAESVIAALRDEVPPRLLNPEVAAGI